MGVRHCDGDVHVYDEQRRKFVAAQNSLEAVDRRESAAK
jgi:hypothetical protein